MDRLVAEESDDTRAGSNNNDARPSGDVTANGIEQLSANDAVYGGPTYSCYGVENGDFIPSLATFVFE